MGKKKDKKDHESGASCIKKSKKHKHKKSSRKDEKEKILNVEQMENVFILVDDLELPNAELETKVNQVEIPISDKNLSPAKIALMKSKLEKHNRKLCKKKDGKGDDETDSEEERWLDAIQSGKLEEVDDELKRMKNPRLMTARQRAMLEKRTDAVDESLPVIPAEPLMALPSGFKEKVMTEEMLAKKAIKSEKRRVQAQEKREEDKKKTVDRLLKKQDSKTNKGRAKTTRKDVPVLSYINNDDGFFVSIPVGSEFGFATQVKREIPDVKLCGVKGCENQKKYSCSKSGVPLCSLKCYKENLASLPIEFHEGLCSQ